MALIERRTAEPTTVEDSAAITRIGGIRRVVTITTEEGDTLAAIATQAETSPEFLIRSNPSVFGQQTDLLLSQHPNSIYFEPGIILKYSCSMGGGGGTHNYT